MLVSLSVPAINNIDKLLDLRIYLSLLQQLFVLISVLHSLSLFT